MNDSGAYLWQLIQNGFNEEQITAIMSEQFSISSETAKASLKVFLDHLLEEQLIISVETLPVKEQVMVESKEMVYNPPELTVFNDMQELLLLDPIHEISEQGWPHFAQNTLEKF